MVPGPLGVLTASTDSLTDDTSARLGKVIQDLSIISKLEQLILFSIQKKIKKVIFPIGHKGKKCYVHSCTKIGGSVRYIIILN